MSPTGFEKWQALGNDYLIFEERALPFALTAAAHPAHLRRPHRRRLGRDPAAVSARRAGLRRAPADLQPRRLGVRAVGQRRARGRHVPAPQRLDGRRPLLDPDRRRGDPPAHHRPGHLHAGHGPRAHVARRTSRRATPTARRSSRPAGARWRFQHVAVGNPQCAIHVADADELERARPARDRAADHGARALSQPHERLLVRRARAGRHPRADLRARRGGDDVLRHRRQRRRDRLRPARRRLARDRAPRRRRARSSTSPRTCTST